MSEYIVVCDEKGVPEYPRRVRDEIVRCRDCKWCKEFEAGYVEGFKCIRVSTPFETATDGFCAWAERKEGGE